jgi:hypothetical protein
LTLLRQSVVCGVFVLSSLVGSVGAQSPERDSYRWAIAPAFDVGSVPDEYSVHCDDGLVPSYGAGVAVLFRP